MNRQERQTEIDNLHGWQSKAQVALCVDYRGLTVDQFTKFRKELRKSGANAKVVKNSLSLKAIDKGIASKSDAEVTKYKGLFKGPTLLIISEVDPVAPAKVVAKFAKDMQALQIKGAWLDGTYLDQTGVEDLSKMPGKQEVLAQLLALINTPATQLLRLMNTPSTQMLTVLDGHRKNLEAKAA
jgi:large subunit ribosomal protein L10